MSDVWDRIAALPVEKQAQLLRQLQMQRTPANLLPDQYIKYYDFDFMPRLHIGMTEELLDAELETQFAKNRCFLEQFAGQLADTVIEMFVDDQDHEAIRSQVQHWQADQFLTELITLYQQASQEHPNGGWITLGRQKQERQEIAE